MVLGGLHQQDTNTEPLHIPTQIAVQVQQKNTGVHRGTSWIRDTTILSHVVVVACLPVVRAVFLGANVPSWGTVVRVLVRITAHVILHAAGPVHKADAPADIRVHIIHHLHRVPSIMVARAMPPPAHVQSQHKRVIHHVHRLPIAKHAAGQNRVPVRAAFQMVHVHTAVQPVHISIHVAAIIQVVAVSLRVRHVRDVIHGHAPAPAPALAEQSASHAIRGTIYRMAVAFRAKPAITAPGITVGMDVRTNPIIQCMWAVQHQIHVHGHVMRDTMVLRQMGIHHVPHAVLATIVLVGHTVPHVQQLLNPAPQPPTISPVYPVAVGLIIHMVPVRQTVFAIGF